MGLCRSGIILITPQKDYWYFDTQDENGDKGLSGDVRKRQAPKHAMTTYVTVKSIGEYLVKIQQSGGQIMVPKTEIPDVGYFAIQRYKK
ncbi:MAG: hypothetical protein M3162_06240 [Thermoproteota archaeon]|nr:hypothetical protein [Thermoproteota archaeon]